MLVKTIYTIYNLVENFKIIQQFNTLENTFNGVYSSRLITHDLFTKTFKEYDFDYNVEYGKQNHLEQDASGGKRDDNGILLPYFNYDKGDTFGTRTKVYYTFNHLHQKYITITNN